VQRERREADRKGIAVEEGDRVFRAKLRRRDAGEAQRLGAGKPLASELGLAFADEGQEGLRERREVGLAEAAGIEHDRVDAGVQHVAERRREARRDSRGAAGEPGEADEQHRPDLRRGQRLADADGPGRDCAGLEAGHVRGAKPRVDGGAEAGGEAVDGLGRAGVAVDDGARRSEAFVHLRGEGDGGPARDRDHVARSERAADDHHGAGRRLDAGGLGTAALAGRRGPGHGAPASGGIRARFPSP
jgi:hypothetical protein